MNKKNVTRRLFVFIILIIVLFFGVYLSNVKKSLNESNECSFLNNVCSIDTPTMNLRIKFKQTPTVEEELLVTFDISPGNTIKKAWIEGANMYMGKTPVIIEQLGPDKINQGLTFLGSCSQAHMEWQLFVEIINTTDNSEVYSATFNTQLD